MEKQRNRQDLLSLLFFVFALSCAFWYSGRGPFTGGSVRQPAPVTQVFPFAGGGAEVALDASRSFHSARERTELPR